MMGVRLGLLNLPGPYEKCKVGSYWSGDSNSKSPK